MLLLESYSIYKMTLLYLILINIFYLLTATEHRDLDICHHNHTHKCLPTKVSLNGSYSERQIWWSNCSEVSLIPKDINLTIMLDENGSSSLGIIKVEFKPPLIRCKYQISLLVNPFINNSEDCENYNFYKNLTNLDQAIHTLERTICSNQNLSQNYRELKTAKQQQGDCKEDAVILWYEHVYTGCYTLRFNLNGNNLFLNNTFLKMDYNKSEVSEPNFRCTYDTALIANNQDLETVTLTSDTSLRTKSSGLVLGISQITYSDLKKENACMQYSKDQIILWKTNIEEVNSTTRNCSIRMVQLVSGNYAKVVDCNFIFEAPKNMGYCLLVQVLDERCHKHTSWNPPLREKIPCTWMQRCLKVKRQKTIAVEQIKTLYLKSVIIPSILYFLLFLASTVIIFAFTSFLIMFYQKRKLHLMKSCFSAKNDCNNKKTEDIKINLEPEISKSLKEKLIKKNGILFIYLRGPDDFMNFMLEFENILNQRTCCEIYDWWAPDKWNEVASIGAYDWAVKMINNGCKVIWIDTPNIRKFLTPKLENNYQKQLKCFVNDDVRDFRDTAIHAILDYAKRNFQDRELEYQKHFVMRMETFKDADKIKDPFANLSPHARFLVPRHLEKLCYHLSEEANYTYGKKDIEMDKLKLKKYLFEGAL